MCQGKGVESWSQNEFPILKDYVDDLFCSAQGAVKLPPIPQKTTHRFTNYFQF